MWALPIPEAVGAKCRQCTACGHQRSRPADAPARLAVRACREVKPHRLVAATASGNRLFILAISANSRQWRKAQEQLRVIQQSFAVPRPKAA